MRSIWIRAAMATVVLTSANLAGAQTPETATPKPVMAIPPGKPAIDATTLVLDITVARFQGDKRISNVPYTLAMVPDSNRGQLRVGGQVPVPVMLPASKDSDAKPVNSFSYRDIGTNIDVVARAVGDGRYTLYVTLEETSVYPVNEMPKNEIVANAPSFRSLRASSGMTLKNGQTFEFTTAADRISGEVARISVKLTTLN